MGWSVKIKHYALSKEVFWFSSVYIVCDAVNGDVITESKVVFDCLDPVTVIGLYPHLLPSDIRQSVIQPLPTAPPTLSGDNLTRGIYHLIKYLTQVHCIVCNYPAV